MKYRRRTSIDGMIYPSAYTYIYLVVCVTICMLLVRVVSIVHCQFVCCHMRVLRGCFIIFKSIIREKKKNELQSFFLGLIEGCDIWQIRLKILWASTRRTRYSILNSQFSILVSRLDWVTDWPSNWQPIRPYTRANRQTDRWTDSPCPGDFWPSSQMGVADCDSGKRVNNSSERKGQTAK